MELGYVGLGNMGGALARRLMLKNKLRVYDLRPDVVAGFAENGALPTQNLESLAQQSDLVMTCLPTSTHVRTAIFGEGGLLAGLKPGSIIADMTTGDPTQTREMAKTLAEKGITLIDAPVSGGPRGANAGTIAIMVGASKELYDKLHPLFATISPNIFHCGDIGAGHVMKLVNNVILAGARAATFEAVAMGVKNGLTLAACAEVLNKGSARNSATEFALPLLAKGPVQLSFAIELMHKDVKLATQLGADSAAPMPISNLVREIYQMGVNEHGGATDVNMLIHTFERLSGVSMVARGSK